MKNLPYFISGMLVGTIFLKAEIISWLRIQEMFRFQSIHMFGVIGTAVVTGIVSVALIKKFKLKALDGQPIVIPAKIFNMGQIYGGLIFGLGWAMIGACPGPLYAQVGAGFSVIIVAVLSAIAGAWVYGLFVTRLPL